MAFNQPSHSMFVLPEEVVKTCLSKHPALFSVLHEIVVRGDSNVFRVEDVARRAKLKVNDVSVLLDALSTSTRRFLGKFPPGMNWRQVDVDSGESRVLWESLQNMRRAYMAHKAYDAAKGRSYKKGG